jgi:periplasmic protein TonB
MTEQQERRNKQIAMIASLGIHGLLLLAFMLMMAWRAPNPPLPEYGIELNFGLDEQGGGDIQPETSPGEQQTEDEPQQQESNASEQQEQTEDEPVSDKPVEQVVSKVESPVVVKEEKKETTKEVVKEKPVESKPKETPKEVVKKEEKTEVKPTESVSATGKKGDATTSQGDDKGKTGDKGSPEGNVDAKALYGKQGGGGGGDGPFGLSMGGWTWADQPKIPNLPDNEDGRIEFEIECDSDGEIISIKTIQRGLSPKAEQLLRDEILRNSLQRTSAGTVPERSKGTVVFILKTK